jgi:DNA-binding MarR family transcriptional regulator
MGGTYRAPPPTRVYRRAVATTQRLVTRNASGLAASAQITKQAMSEATSDLERLGYLERVPDPTDRRARILRLTARGKQAQRTGFAILDDIEADWARQYGAEQMRELRAVLAQHTGERHR